LLPELIDAVVARGDGVPFFIEELLAAALGEADSWRLVPGSIAAAVDARLRLLPESTGRVLGFAAMLGRNFDWHVAPAATACPPLREGSLGSAEALARRAQGARPVAADRVLLSTWTIAGQPRRALEAGRRILSAGDCDPADRIEVLFELVDAMITAGRWYDAESYLETLRSAPGLDRSGAARRAIGEAEGALARNDSAAAVAFGRAALADARDNGLAEVTCRALWVIGRVERGSG